MITEGQIVNLVSDAGYKLVCDRGRGHHAPQITTRDAIVPVGSVKI